jgi:hypothetical protein
LARKLLEAHRKDQPKITNIINVLTKELGSHDYLISRSEAQELLGKQVILDDELERLIWELYQDYAAEMQLGKEYDASLVHRVHRQRSTRIAQAAQVEVLVRLQTPWRSASPG